MHLSLQGATRHGQINFPKVGNVVIVILLNWEEKNNFSKKSTSWLLNLEP